MADEKAPLRKYIWRYVNVLLFLFVLARLYAYAITYSIVPEFPDPVLKFLAKINDQTDTALDPISHVIGPLIFGVMLKWYSPKFEGGARRKGAPAKGRKDRRVNMFDGKKQLVIIAGRLIQCGIFGWRECLPQVYGGAKEAVCVGDCSRRVFDVVVSAALAAAEVNGWEWDGGFVEKGLLQFWKVIGRDADSDEAETEEKPEDKEENVDAAVGKSRKIKR